MTESERPNFTQRIWLRIMGISLILYSRKYLDLVKFFGQYWNLGVFVVYHADRSIKET